jgi:hypothetical protein
MIATLMQEPGEVGDTVIVMAWERNLTKKMRRTMLTTKSRRRRERVSNPTMRSSRVCGSVMEFSRRERKLSWYIV